MKKIIALIVIILLFTGCTKYTEINNLAIVDMILLEKQEDQYILNITTVKGQKEENDTGIKHQTYHIEGKSLGEAFNKAEQLDNKKTYYEHLALIIIHDSLLQEDAINILDFIKNQFPKTNYLVLGTTSSTTLISNQFKGHQDIEKFIKKEQLENATIAPLTFDQIYKATLDKEHDSFIPMIRYQEETLSGAGIKVLKNNTLYDQNMSKINYLLNNNVNQIPMTLEKDNKSYFINFDHLNVTTSFRKDTFTITITGDLQSSDVTKKEQEEMEALLKEQLKKEITTFIEMEQKESISTTNLKNLVYLKMGNKEKLDTTYQKSKLNIKINTTWKGETIDD